MLRKRPFLRLFSLLSVMLVAVLLVAACGGGSAPADSAPAAEAPAAEAAAQESADAAAPASADDYQASREACTAETPCWAEVVDTVPDSFQEAPMLAEMVAAGDLPPVEERLPGNPLVIQPAEMIGEYGGTLRRAFTGPGDRQNVERWVNDYGVFWNTGASELRPRLLESWEANEDASEWTFHLREA
ncbi:MAG: hypothetical protein HC802_18745 [Caldilineaceae bacterium]|nr:hypothetical protein [Caldilineaceae bacterium]